MLVTHLIHRRKLTEEMIPQLKEKYTGHIQPTWTAIKFWENKIWVNYRENPWNEHSDKNKSGSSKNASFPLLLEENKPNIAAQSDIQMHQDDPTSRDKLPCKGIGTSDWVISFHLHPRIRPSSPQLHEFTKLSNIKPHLKQSKNSSPFLCVHVCPRGSLSFHKDNMNAYVTF